MKPIGTQHWEAAVEQMLTDAAATRRSPAGRLRDAADAIDVTLHHSDLVLEPEMAIRVEHVLRLRASEPEVAATDADADAAIATARTLLRQTR